VSGLNANLAFINHQDRRISTSTDDHEGVDPARFAARAKCEDDKASLSRLVSGDLATTANLAEVVNGVPTSGLDKR